MATVEKVKLTLTLSNGKTASINLPAAVSTALDDPEEAYDLTRPAFNPIKAAYADDAGNTVEKITYAIVTTTTSTITENYAGE